MPERNRRNLAAKRSGCGLARLSAPSSLCMQPSKAKSGSFWLLTHVCFCAVIAPPGTDLTKRQACFSLSEDFFEVDRVDDAGGPTFRGISYHFIIEAITKIWEVAGS